MLSSRSKIRINMVFVVFISLITSIVSLYYTNRMVRRIKAITTKDARIAELGENLSFRILEAKREEKNFVIYLDSTYISRTQNILAEMHKDLNEAQSLSQTYAVELDSILFYLSLYQKNIHTLRKTFQEDPNALNKLQQQVINYQKELQTLARRQKLSLSDLPEWTSDINASMLAASTRLSADKARLFEELKNQANNILRLTQEMTGMARQSLAENSDKAMEFGNKAQRNILTFLLITCLLLSLLIVYLPHRIFLPFIRISKALQAIGRGETDVTLPNIDTNDELGDLSRSFQKAIKRLQLFNDLRMSKIAELRRNRNKVLDETSEAVIITDSDYNVRYMNESAQQLFQLNQSETDRISLRNLKGLWESLSGVFSGTKFTSRREIAIQSRKKGLKKKHAVLIPQFGTADKIEQITIIIK